MPSDDDFEAAKRHLAANIAGLRATRGWSQQEAADAAGLDLKHLQKVEYGSLNVSLATLVRLARAFQTSVGALLEKSASRPQPPERRVGRPRGTSRSKRAAT